MTSKNRTHQIISSRYRESDDFSTLMNYRVLRGGHLIAFPDFYVQRHSVAGHELLFCLRGKGYIKLEGKEYAVKANQLAWIPVQLPHEHFPDKEDPWEILWIRIDGGKLNNIMNILDTINKPIFQFEQPEKVTEIYHHIFSTMQGHTLLADARCDTLCAQMIYILMENRSFEVAKSPVIMHRGLGRLIYQIHSHYSNDWDIEKFMHYCQVSKSQLFRLFNSTFNQSPLRWLKNYRLAQARRLLVETEESISHIAWQIGYNDPLHFSRDFHVATGMSPSKFRQQERENNI